MSVPLTLIDNRPTPAPLSDVAIKISKPGYNALNTSGGNFIFDSSWPSLPIAYEATANSVLNVGNTQTFTHNLNFCAFALIFAYGPDLGGNGNVMMRFVPNIGKNSVTIDKTQYTLNQQAFLQTATKINVKVFRLDLARDIDYVLAAGDTFKMPYDPDFGIKVVKKTKSITSPDLRDFILHSRAQSPLILAVKTQATADPANAAFGGNGAVQYTSRQKNPVWVYGFVLTAADTYKYAPFYTQSYPRTFTDGYITYLQWVNYTLGVGGATLVVTRDPMFAPTQETVQY